MLSLGRRGEWRQVMSKEYLPARSDKPSAFTVARRNSDQHIIDELIEERCPSFVAHWTWPALRPVLLSALGYRTAVRWADHMQEMGGIEAFNYLAS